MKKYLIALMVLVLALALVACGETADTTVPATDAPETEHVHSFTEEIIPATCSTTGKVVTACACGEVQSEAEIPLADHTASALDCEKDTVCTVCNTVLAEKTGHIFGASEVVTAATCGTAGKEKGACLSCGKVVENEIPATGHIIAAGAALTKVDGGFATTCGSCNQSVTLKESEVLFKLTFDGDVAEEAAKYDAGLSLFKPETINVVDGAIKIVDAKTLVYLDIDDPSKIASNSVVMMSFDLTLTKEISAGSKASVFSLLNFFYNGKNNYQGTTGWGWALKHNADLGKFVITTDNAKVTDATSYAVELNTKYNIQLVFDTNAKGCFVFINGTCIGKSVEAATFAGLKDAVACLRFGDGPAAGYVYDNFAITVLK